MATPNGIPGHSAGLVGGDRAVVGAGLQFGLHHEQVVASPVLHRGESHCLAVGHRKSFHNVAKAYTEVFGSTRFGNNDFSEITDILAIPKLTFCIKKSPKLWIPTDPLLPKTSVHWYLL